VLWHCWLGGRKGVLPVKNGGWWRWALLSPDGLTPIRMVGVSASVNLPLHHKVQKFLSGTVSPGCSRKKGHKTIVVWWGVVVTLLPLPWCYCKIVIIPRVILLSNTINFYVFTGSAWYINASSLSCQSLVRSQWSLNVISTDSPLSELGVSEMW